MKRLLWPVFMIVSACGNMPADQQPIALNKYVTPLTLQETINTASGFFVTNDGYILTSYHAIANHQDFQATLNNGHKVTAKLIDSEPNEDIALLKADVVSIPLALTKSAHASKGGQVLTLGYPLVLIQGQEQKASFGHINAFSGIHGDKRVMQVDIPMQPGNSGGPLINDNGQAIGMIAATFNQMTALKEMGALTQNINFAIKTDMLLPILQRNIADKFLLVEGAINPRPLSDIIKQSENSVLLITSK